MLPVELPEAEDIVQRFKVSVHVDEDFMEEDEGVPFFVRGMLSGGNIRLNIEYSDYAVGRTLQVCVQDWVKALSRRRVPGIIKWAERHADLFSYLTPYVFGSAALLGASRLSFYDDNKLSFQLLIQTMAISLIFMGIGRYLIIAFYRQIELAKPLTFIQITNGDSIRAHQLKSRQRIKAGLAVFIFVTIVSGVAINLFSAYLWSTFLQ